MTTVPKLENQVTERFLRELGQNGFPVRFIGKAVIFPNIKDSGHDIDCLAGSTGRSQDAMPQQRRFLDLGHDLSGPD